MKGGGSTPLLLLSSIAAFTCGAMPPPNIQALRQPVGRGHVTLICRQARLMFMLTGLCMAFGQQRNMCAIYLYAIAEACSMLAA